MKKNKFDYIICGGGASGLLLANELISDPFFINKRILLIEMDKKNINDRTWCFWEKGKGKLDKIVSKSWNYACFKDKSFEKNYETKPYTYKLIRGIDFYNNFRNLNRKQNNLTYLNAKVSNINKLKNIVITNKGSFSAEYIFTSILDIKLLENQKKYPLLKQHFIGQLVEVKNDIFNPDLVTFMDFDIPQRKSTRFMYILPFSKTKALVEYTLFSKNELEKREYINSIKSYLNNLNSGDFKIIEQEKGIIPMTTYKFESGNTKKLLNIGTAGGWSKASTGYTFLNTINKVESLVSFLKTGKPVNQFEKRSRFWFYDLLFLDVLSKHNDKGHSLFKRMFEKNKLETIFKFLDNKTNIIEEFRLIMTFKKKWFIEALINRIF